MSTDTPEPVRKAKPSRRLTILRVLLGTAAFGLAILLAAWATVCRNNACPSLEGLADYDPAQASKVYAADGRLITDLGLERRTVVPLKEISPAVIEALLISSPSGVKKPVPNSRSISCMKPAAVRTGRANACRTAVINMLQIVSGNRNMVMPGARIWMIVVM